MDLEGLLSLSGKDSDDVGEVESSDFGQMVTIALLEAVCTSSSWLVSHPDCVLPPSRSWFGEWEQWAGKTWLRALLRYSPTKI